MNLPNLINRLRGIYAIPVNDGAGLLDGKDTFTRTFEVPPIQKEAADTIEVLQHLIQDLDARFGIIPQIYDDADNEAWARARAFVGIAPRLEGEEPPTTEEITAYLRSEYGPKTS